MHEELYNFVMGLPTEHAGSWLQGKVRCQPAVGHRAQFVITIGVYDYDHCDFSQYSKFFTFDGFYTFFKIQVSPQDRNLSLFSKNKFYVRSA